MRVFFTGVVSRDTFCNNKLGFATKITVVFAISLCYHKFTKKFSMKDEVLWLKK